MPRFLIPLLPAALALGCATHQVEFDAIGAAGDQLETAPAPGERFEATFTTIDGEAIAVPDPGGQVVVIELIRSADW
jgi:hypothetical protein